MDYIDYGNKCLKMAESSGIDHAEVFITNARLISAGIEKGSIKLAKDSYDHGISIRIVRKGSIGFSFSTDFELKSLENMVTTAVKLSKTGIPDPDFRDFPHPSSYPSVKGMFDEKIAKKGISRPVVESVVMHGRKIKNSPKHYIKFLLLGYVVVMHGKRVVSAFYDKELV